MAPPDDSQSQPGHQSPEQAPTQADSTRSSRTRPPVKINPVYRPSETESESDAVDIFAIHGLDTKSPDTWIWKDDPKNPNERGVNWLADKHMLPSRVGRSHIFTCDWPAELFETRDFAEHTFEELARLLLDSILGYHTKDRPIVFIASCLGGIILMKALDVATSRYLPIKIDTRAILFLATPFRGTAFEDVAKWAEFGLRAWAKSRGCRVTERLDLATTSVPELRELRHKFTQIIKEQNYEVSTIYETRYTNLYRKIPLFRPRKRLVRHNLCRP